MQSYCFRAWMRHLVLILVPLSSLLAIAAYGQGGITVIDESEPPPAAQSTDGNEEEIVIDFFGEEESEADKAGEQAPAEATIEVDTASGNNEHGLTQAQLNSMVIIEGDNGVGSGFIAKIKDVHFVVTNIHVLAPNSTLKITNVQGKKIPVGPIFAAVDHDVAIIRIEEQPNALEIANNVSSETTIGDDIITPGNESGGGVITETKGRIRGIGPRLIEVDSKFVQGNSGSPILHKQSGKVIGIATYAIVYNMDKLREAANLEETRWFGYRLDTISQWQGIDWDTFREESKQFSEIQSTTESFISLLAGEGSMGHSDIDDAYRIFRRDVSRDDMHAQFYLRAIQRLTRRMVGITESDLSEFEEKVRTDYFQRELKKQKKYREVIREFLRKYDREIAEMRSNY